MFGSCKSIQYQILRSWVTPIFKAPSVAFISPKEAENNPENAVTTARSLLYQGFPSTIRWIKNAHKWQLYKSKKSAVNRMYFVHPAAQERFCVCLLLTVVQGALLLLLI